MRKNLGIRITISAVAVLATALALSCGGGSSGGSAQMSPGGVMQPPPPAIQPTFTSIQANVFSQSCALSGCHAGSAPQMGMNLSSGQAFSNIVNVASAEQPSFLRVKPGDATNSYLYMKITGDLRISGVQMPATGGPLSADKIAAIRDWINAGANP